MLISPEIQHLQLLAYLTKAAQVPQTYFLWWILVCFYSFDQFGQVANSVYVVLSVLLLSSYIFSIIIIVYNVLGYMVNASESICGVYINIFPLLMDIK